jgi:protein-disulfide isomerase
MPAITEISLDTLTWGQGPHRFEMFLEPTCPHSARAFGKLRPFVKAAGEDRVTARIVMQSQPWHLFSGVVTRTVLAAAAVGGKEAAFAVMEQIYDHREEFVATDHSSGPNLDMTLADKLRRIEELSGLDVADAFRLDAVTVAMKLHARYARQNGIHASPTFIVDGLVNDKLGSRDEIETWVAALGR